MSYSPEALVSSATDGTNDEQMMKFYLAFIVFIQICFTLTSSSSSTSFTPFSLCYEQIELSMRNKFRERLSTVIFGERFTLKDSLLPQHHRSHQTSDNVTSGENSNAGASAEPKFQGTTEAITHIDDGQKGNGDIRENDQTNIGTDGCCNCRLG